MSGKSNQPSWSIWLLWASSEMLGLCTACNSGVFAPLCLIIAKAVRLTEKCVGHNMFITFLSTTSSLNMFRWYILVLMELQDECRIKYTSRSISYRRPTWTKPEVCGWILVTLTNVKCHEKPFSSSQLVADGQREMGKLIVAFSQLLGTEVPNFA
jgi:hypothetical protein